MSAVNHSAVLICGLLLLPLAIAKAVASPDNNSSPGYFRAPAAAGDALVFTAEGDLWLSSLSQPQQSRRLTTDAAEETAARWSADGQFLAYQANYQGVTEIYLIGKAGGSPKRLSFENSKVKLQGWTADGKVLYSTDSQIGPNNSWVLKTVSPTDLSTETLPLADAVEGQIDPSDGSIYFIRYGLQVTGDSARQYRGGAMGQLWKYNPKLHKEAVRLLPDHQGSIRSIQINASALYFVSDASGNGNLWQVDKAGQQAKQLTQFNDLQLRSVQVDQQSAVFQLGADILQLDLASGAQRTLGLKLSSDYPYRKARFLEQPLTYLEQAAVAENSTKAVLTVRGQLQVVQPSPLRTVRIATAQGSRSRQAVLSPDGKYVYAINDASGENEIWRYAADGSAEAKQLTDNGSTFRWNLHLSPDGRYLAHDDKHGDLWLYDLNSGKNQKIYSGANGLSPYQAVIWSNDSSMLAFTLEPLQKDRSQLVLYPLATGKATVLTSEAYVSYSPAFSPDTQWLYFLSERQFEGSPAHPWGDRNMGPAFDKRAMVYAMPLQTGVHQPFYPKDELTPATAADKSAKADKTASKTVPAGLSVQLPSTLYPIAIPSGNYQKLQVSKDYLYLLEEGVGEQPGNLLSVKISDQPVKVSTFAEKVQDFSLAQQAKKVFTQKKTGTAQLELRLSDAAETAGKAPEQVLNSNNLTLRVEPAQEWMQMFKDAWIMHRESLFDPNMRGVDWQASKAKYLPLVSRLTDRYELDDVLAQMMGELDTLHSQVRGGDYPKQSEQAKQGTLGARLVQSSDGVQINEIYQVDADLPQLAGPLAKPGLEIHNGDVISAVNGLIINNLAELNQALLQQQDQQVLLTLKRGKTSYSRVVTPVSPQQDSNLRYQHWVEKTQAKVQQQGNGQLGYLHLNAMTPSDLSLFVRDFYAQADKAGLIIDVRRNRGGNIDSIIIEKLLRRAWAFWQPVQGKAYANMQNSFRGKLVVLADPLTYSDGETFTAGIRALGLGTVIGQTTAGAGVWLSGRNQLTDRGVARVAETAQFAMDGRWILEGRGVSPDLVVDNLPHASFNGQDAQLAAAIGLLQQQIKQHPIPEFRALPLPPGHAADILPVK